jgi:hypothetical protein
MAKETLAVGVQVLVPTTIEGVVNLPALLKEATRITVVGDHHQVISLQTILDNSIHHHRIISLHQAVGIQKAEVDGEVSGGVEVVGDLEEEDTTTIDERISMRLMDDFVSLIFSPFFIKCVQN